MAKPEILMYTTAVCPYCVAAKNYMKNKGLSWREIRVDTDAEQRRIMLEQSKRTSVPQIFIGSVHVGGYDDLVALDRAGELLPMMESSL